MIAYSSKKLSAEEEGYCASDHKVLELIYFLKRFRCYLEGATFEKFTDNQVLKNFFTKPSMRRKEPTWLETLGNFGIFPMNLQPGKMHVLGDVLYRARHITNEQKVRNAFELPYIGVSNSICRCEEDQFSGHLHVR